MHVGQLGAKGRGVAVGKEAGDGDVVRTSGRCLAGGGGGILPERMTC